MNKICCCDYIDLCKSIPNEHIDLVIIDPPYNLNLAKWDNQDLITYEFVNQINRITKDSSSIYVWGGLVKWECIF